MKKGPFLMGVINVSPESFYKGSVPKNARALMQQARKLEKDGADAIDVGAMSTAPYLQTRISEIEEAKRLSWAVNIVRASVRLPLSIDTARLGPALAGLNAGATYLNDVTGLHGDPRLAKHARYFKKVFLMAHPIASPAPTDRPLEKIKKILRNSVDIALKNGVSRKNLILDPGIGFFRNEKRPWWRWDVETLRGLNQLTTLKCPLLIGVSRKSFIGHMMGGVPPEKRLAGSLAATVAGVRNGAAWVRTHDIKETKRFLSYFGLSNK